MTPMTIIIMLLYRELTLREKRNKLRYCNQLSHDAMVTRLTRNPPNIWK